MGPKDMTVRVPDMFRQPLIELLNSKHELVRLADAMDWSPIEQSFDSYFGSATGRPAFPPRLVAGLLYLQHAYDSSDEVAVNTWIENPYWQYYSCETYFQTEAPIDPSSLTRWRKRVGEEGVETMLMATIGMRLDRDVLPNMVSSGYLAHSTNEDARQDDGCDDECQSAQAPRRNGVAAIGRRATAKRTEPARVLRVRGALRAVADEPAAPSRCRAESSTGVARVSDSDSKRRIVGRFRRDRHCVVATARCWREGSP